MYERKFDWPNIAKRGLQAINLKQYGAINSLEEVKEMDIPLDEAPFKEYILRMIIKTPESGGFLIQPKFNWLVDLINEASRYQHDVLKIIQPYCYLTVRHGPLESINDDVWHVDGFSMSITHLPEQNYIWTDIHPTEYVEQGFDFPFDFDPLIHNIHYFFQDKISSEIKVMKPKTLYCLDPYVVHRRPNIPAGTYRTFVRISFTPIEIRDDNNTPNPYIDMPKYHKDGIKDVRDKLIKYYDGL